MAWASEWGDIDREILDNSSYLLGKLDEIIAKRLERLYQEEIKADFYEQGYHVKQPFVNGQKKAFHDLRKLLKP